MDALTLVILAIGALLFVRALFSSPGTPDYVVIEVQRAPQPIGCLPVVLALLAAMLVFVLIAGGW